MHQCYNFAIREEMTIDGIDPVPFFRFRIGGFREDARDVAVFERQPVDIGSWALPLSVSIEKTNVEIKCPADRLHAVTVSWCQQLPFNDIGEEEREVFFLPIRRFLLEEGEDDTIEREIKEECRVAHQRFFETLRQGQRLLQDFWTGGDQLKQETIRYEDKEDEQNKVGKVTLSRSSPPPSVSWALVSGSPPQVDEPQWFKDLKDKESVCFMAGSVPVAMPSLCFLEG